MKQLLQSKNVWNKLDTYQQDAVEFSYNVFTAALFFEQGTGKTWIAGGLIEKMFGRFFEGLLIVELTNLESTWYTFIEEHLTQFNLCRSWDEFKNGSTPKLLVLHYEAAKLIIKKIQKHDFSIIIYDEAQRLKGRGTRQSRDAKLIRNCAMRKLILSGTPIEEQPSDLWAQFRFLRPTVFGTRWADFEERFMIKEEIDPNLPVGSMRWKRALRLIRMKKAEFNWKKLPQFLELIKPYSLRVEAKDVLNLKPMSIIPVPVKMWGDQARVYNELEQTMVTRLEGVKVTAPLKITQIGKLQQICGGLLFDEDGEVHRIGRAKLRKMNELVDQRTGPCVIFCKYREEIDMIKEELTRIQSVVVLTGQTKKKLRPGILKNFQDGKIDVLLCQSRIRGVDLFSSNYAIVYSRTHSFIDFSQLIKRLHRRGQKRAVSIFLLYCLGTVDEDINSGIDKKHRLTSRVLTTLIMRRRSWVKKRHTESRTLQS